MFSTLRGNLKPGGVDMLDLIYLATGAAFLALCVLYSVACDRL
jgi:hypothetical protein